MHFSTQVILPIAALSAITMAKGINHRRQMSNTCIVDTVTNPSATDAEAAINQWNIDVNTVNDFLNNVNNFQLGMEVQNQTMQTLLFAQDEPCQLQTLINNPDFVGGGADAFNCAAMDLMKVFEIHVLDNLKSIIAMPNDHTVVANAVDDIDIFRCCNVLPDADILWQDSADDNGISDRVTITAGRERACENIACENVATTANCASLGN